MSSGQHCKWNVTLLTNFDSEFCRKCIYMYGIYPLTGAHKEAMS